MGDQISLEAIAARLKPVPSLDSLENYLANRLLYPQALPLKKSDMQIDQSANIAYLEKTNNFAPLNLRIEKDVVTRIKRLIPGGRVIVRLGQEITPDEIIGHAILTSGFRILNLASLLVVSPREAVRFLTRKIGQNIYKGELLAYKKGGLLGGKKVVTSPTDGVLEVFNEKNGELKIAFLPQKKELPAGVYGIVEGIDNDGVIIRTQVSRVHGIGGSGRSREGILHFLTRSEDLVKGKVLKYDQSVLVVGNLLFKKTISAAISLGINGIIIGGMNATDYKGMAGGSLVFPKKLANDIGISIVVCEGFGGVPLGGDIFEILSEYEGRFVFIDGNQALINLPSPSSASLIKVKNTILPNSENFINKHEAQLKIGLKVRIIGNSYLGEQGKVKAIDDTLTLLPSGIKARLITVETPRRKIQVPVANLEIIM